MTWFRRKEATDAPSRWYPGCEWLHELTEETRRVCDRMAMNRALQEISKPRRFRADYVDADGSEAPRAAIREGA